MGDINLNELKYKMDRVIVDNKQFKTISNFWKEENILAAVHREKLFFPLSDFILDVELDRQTKLFGLVELMNYSPLSYTFTSDLIHMTCIRKENGWDIDALDTSIRNHTEDEIQQYAEINNSFIVCILIYIIMKGEERRRIYKDIFPHATDEFRTEAFKKVYKDRECFLLNDIVEFVTDHPTRKSIQYLKDVWGVRGHLRHYQNGVVVFIKPYKKGRMRDTKEPESKTYLLEKNEPIIDEQTERDCEA